MKSVSRGRRRVAQILAAAVVGGFTLGLASVGQAAETLVARMDFAPWGLHGAMHLAKEKGWFAKEGLNVDIQDGTGSINTLQLLAVGRADVGQVSVGTMAVAKENGLDLISIAGFVRTGDLAVMTDEKLGVKKPSDLIGKKIDCFTTSPWAPFIGPYLKANKLTREQVRVVMVAPSAMISTYASGNSDGFMSQAPFGLPMVKKARAASALLLADSGISFPSYGLVTTPAALASKRDALRKLVQIQVKTWKYIYDGHVDEAVQAILHARPNARLDPEVLKGQIEAYRPFFDSPSDKSLPMGVQSDADWSAAIKSMQQTGLIKPGHKPSDYYTNALLAN
jgi:NitT/TauT family transport system substrate-binding protein